MILYIAGPMTGLPDSGRKVFRNAEQMLEKLGYTVISPAWLSDKLPRDAYMPICLAMIDQAEGVALLPGWENSKGAQVEKAYAEYQGKFTETVGEWAICRDEMLNKD